MNVIKVKRALISVSDKSNLETFVRFLHGQGVEIISTGGTLKKVQELGVPARPIDELTGFPEMMDGRLKTLHPRVHGGLLALLDQPTHVASMKEHGIESIDLLVVNLYPFASTVAGGGNFAEVIENIDIGGPAMIRAGSKNYRFTAVVCDPDSYPSIMEAIERDGGISETLSLDLARLAFNHTASYDAMIADYLNKKNNVAFPDTLTLTYRKMQPLRYGENPHQHAAYYRPVMDLAREKAQGLTATKQIQGKELSYNNLLDFSSALGAVLSLPGEGSVIVKHLNPCGASIRQTGESLLDAFLRARACDPVSAFGGVMAFSGTVDEDIAAAVNENFAEGIIAPAFTPGALQYFSEKKNLRVMQVSDPARFLQETMEIRQVYDGVLYENMDNIIVPSSEWRVVTRKKPDPETMKALEFAWSLVKSVKSNAIVFCSGNASLGIGAGQMSRIDSVEIAISKAKKAGLSLQGSVAGSDAFFPFRDGVDALASAGAIAVVQPGGSVRDQEVIDAADEHGLAMIFTGMRHFRH